VLSEIVNIIFSNEKLSGVKAKQAEHTELPNIQLMATAVEVLPCTYTMYGTWSSYSNAADGKWKIREPQT